jgi:hypothetical protein
VEFALKLGYSEALLQKALLKVGLAAQQNELLDELIRLQHIRAVDPKVNFHSSMPALLKFCSETFLYGTRTGLFFGLSLHC